MADRYDYDYDIWPLFYDQYYSDLHAREAPFYLEELAGCRDPVLEVGCGTGTFLFKLLDAGLDAYGIDVAQPMLRELFRRAEAQGRSGLGDRVSRQNLVDFGFDRRFGAVMIPARTFLHLVTQEEQIAALRNVHAHLKPGGRLLLNFFAPELPWFVEQSKRQALEPFERYAHPETGQRVELWIARRVEDVSSQIIHVRWCFRIGEQTHETKMTLRWVHRAEFELLLRLAGFGRWELYGDFDRSPFDDSRTEMIWIAHRGEAAEP